ncbi:hypothetical protein [Pseudarthrobacter sp. C4D7]|uniref:hypothetical protein n=1 Tax=Pseudarthrobacter sp. C4D7 TaxID=2735268 RepID=UPI00158497E2|nr:hypothetical protein [Pseudarthrobacter sp. C4D7]NUT72366.1 hypothetical protein [Pseudarthrobacter sp. C4D7]
MDIASILISAAVFVVPIAVGATLLYWIIRLGVKHGLRSFYAERTIPTDGVAPAPADQA